MSAACLPCALQAWWDLVATFANSDIERNGATAATPRGGAIAAYFTQLTFSACVISRNAVTVVPPTAGPFDVDDNSTPYASGSGGAIFLFAGSLSYLAVTNVRWITGPPLCLLLRCTLLSLAFAMAIPSTPRVARSSRRSCRCRSTLPRREAESTPLEE